MGDEGQQQPQEPQQPEPAKEREPVTMPTIPPGRDRIVKRGATPPDRKSLGSLLDRRDSGEG
jgi:hypothetical protein